MRMTFDSIGELGFGVEIGSLVSSLPDLPFVSAFDRSNALCASRYFDPFWKFKKHFSIGSEAKVKEDVRVLDNFIYPLIQKRKQSIQDNEVISESDLLSRILLMAKENPELYDDRKLRDAVLNFLFAGRDGTAITLSWLLWLLSQNSEVEEKIVKELQSIPGLSSAAINENGVSCFEKYSELLTYDVLNNKMHYLHAAITETLRLYPAVPLDGKSAVSNDILPDGSKIAKGNVIFYVPYAMGRMQRLWENDALEFKPERWLNEDGIFQPQSPFKFTAFQAGPRNCMGKDSAYLQMKMAAALLLRFFRFEMVKDHRVKYRVALTLVMPSLPMIGHRRGSRL